MDLKIAALIATVVDLCAEADERRRGRAPTQTLRVLTNLIPKGGCAMHRMPATAPHSFPIGLDDRERDRLRIRDRRGGSPR
jgi:hypothetical protein